MTLAPEPIVICARSIEQDAGDTGIGKEVQKSLKGPRGQESWAQVVYIRVRADEQRNLGLAELVVVVVRPMVRPEIQAREPAVDLQAEGAEIASVCHFAQERDIKRVKAAEITLQVDLEIHGTDVKSRREGSERSGEQAGRSGLVSDI